jgi:hypothetical protein
MMKVGQLKGGLTDEDYPEKIVFCLVAAFIICFCSVFL